MPLTRGLVPIRSGSKSIPDKNIKSFCGKPLFFWAAKAALDSGVFNGGVYVAVDSQKYFDLVVEHLPEATPIFRPAETATDTASSESVLIWFEEQYPADIVSLIQATTPTVRAQDFRKAFEQLGFENSDSLVTGVAFQRFLWRHDGVALNYDPLKRPRRQEMQRQLVENGAFYFTKTTILRTLACRLGGKISVYEMPEESIVEIDEPGDWPKTEAAFRLMHGDMESPSSLKVVVVDVDGTLTDGGMYYGDNGEAFKKFNTRDGAALATLREMGFEPVICSGEDAKSVKQRMEKLGIHHYLPGVKDKEAVLSSWLSSHGYGWNNVVYVGDELNDIQGMRRSAVSFCPSDAHPTVLETSSHVTIAKGGEGVLREVVFHLQSLRQEQIFRK